MQVSAMMIKKEIVVRPVNKIKTISVEWNRE